MFYLSLIPYVSLACTMFHLSLSRTPQLPLTLVYCTLLILLRSRSCVPLWCIRSLVYISPVLVATNLRTNITCLPLYLSEVPSERSETPCHHAIFHAHFSTVLSTLSPTHPFTSFTLPLLSSFSTLFSCYQLAIRLTTFTNFYDLMTIPFILFLFFIHTLSFDEMRT